MDGQTFDTWGDFTSTFRIKAVRPLPIVLTVTVKYGELEKQKTVTYASKSFISCNDAALAGEQGALICDKLFDGGFAESEKSSFGTLLQVKDSARLIEEAKTCFFHHRRDTIKFKDELKFIRLNSGENLNVEDLSENYDVYYKYGFDNLSLNSEKSTIIKGDNTHRVYIKSVSSFIINNTNASKVKVVFKFGGSVDKYRFMLGGEDYNSGVKLIEVNKAIAGDTLITEYLDRSLFENVGSQKVYIYGRFTDGSWNNKE